MMTRRTFAEAALLATAALLTGSGLGPQSFEEGRARSMLRALFSNLNHAGTIAAAHARSARAADPPGLARRPLDFGSLAALRTSVAGRIAEDFETGRLLNLDGWLLAETEVAVCLICTGPLSGV